MVPGWHQEVVCPKCGGSDTHFIEPHYEMSVYECNDCGFRFEIEEED
jgi:transposase-like protein